MRGHEQNQGNRVHPIALLRQAYAQTFDVLLARLEPRAACKAMVQLLALAHERACEAELADLLALDLDQGRLPDLAVLAALFGPADGAMPEIAVVVPTPLKSYEDLGSVRAPHAMGATP